MDCKKIQSLLSEYLDGYLGKDNQNLVEEHLKTCHLCRRELETLQKTVSFVHSLKKVEAPSDFLVGIRERIEKEAEAKSLWRRLITPVWIKAPVGTIATVALCFLILYFAHLLPFSKGPLVTTERMERRTETVLKDEAKGVGTLAENELVKPELELAVADIDEGLSYLSRMAESFGGHLVSPAPAEKDKLLAEKMHQMVVTLEIPSSSHSQFLAKLEETKSAVKEELEKTKFMVKEEKVEAKTREPFTSSPRALAPPVSQPEKPKFLTIQILLIATEK